MVAQRHPGSGQRDIGRRIGLSKAEHGCPEDAPADNSEHRYRDQPLCPPRLSSAVDVESDPDRLAVFALERKLCRVVENEDVASAPGKQIGKQITRCAEVVGWNVVFIDLNVRQEAVCRLRACPILAGQRGCSRLPGRGSAQASCGTSCQDAHLQTGSQRSRDQSSYSRRSRTDRSRFSLRIVKHPAAAIRVLARESIPSHPVQDFERCTDGDAVPNCGQLEGSADGYGFSQS